MKIYQILYSRSLSQDYRWMLTPSWVSSSDLKKLRQIYDEYDDYKTEKPFDGTTLFPIFYLNLPSISTVFTCSPIQQTDQYSRRIYGLQGIAVPANYSRHLWFALPWILLKNKTFLNVSESINPKNADQLQKSSSDINFDFEKCDPSLLGDNLTNPHHKQKLECSNAGFETLVGIISSSEVSRLDFAFGATSGVENIHQWDLIATIGRKATSHQEVSSTKRQAVSSYRETDEQSEYRKSSYPKPQDDFRREKSSGVYSNKKTPDEDNTYDIACVEVFAPSIFSTGSGVYIHSAKNILDKILKKYFPKIQQIYPRAVADFSMSDVYSTYTRNQSLQTVRIHHLGGRDTDIGEWLVKQLREEQWKDFEASGNRKTQLWLRRFKSLG